jgi:hypothetical protein
MQRKWKHTFAIMSGSGRVKTTHGLRGTAILMNFNCFEVLNYSSSNDRFTIYLGKMTDEILHFKSRL